MENYLTKRNVIIALVIIVAVVGAIIWYLSRPATPATSEGGGGFFSRLFPGGGERELTEAERQKLEEEREGGLPPLAPGGKKPFSQKLVSESVSGATIIKNRVRYIERETGHIFEIDPDGQNKIRISNTTIPGIFEVTWSSTGERTVLKYLSQGNLNMLSARFAASSTQGIFLSPDIKDITFSPQGDRIAYVLASKDESSIITATSDNKSQRVIFKSPFRNWRIYWPEENNIYLVNAPSAFNDGFLYRRNLATGAFEKLLGPKLGLAISTNDREVVFSESDRDNQTIVSSFLNVGTRKIKPASLKIIPEKCVWSKLDKNALFCALPVPFPPTIHPDDWYQGKISFSDILIKINTTNLTAASFDLEEGPDTINLFLSPDEKNLFYLNRRDGSLWRVNLK
ncbi:MAG: hypothetical protein Q8R12_00595 [bacterium]|nr:hypothetical protein [bacterium]